MTAAVPVPMFSGAVGAGKSTIGAEFARVLREAGVPGACDPSLWHLDAATICTRRAVATGDELTIDSATQTTHADFEMTCDCGSELCRGTVTGVDWMDTDWQARYHDHLVPAVRRAIQRWGTA
jgi:hypothetical protein